MYRTPEGCEVYQAGQCDASAGINLEGNIKLGCVKGGLTADSTGMARSEALIRCPVLVDKINAFEAGLAILKKPA